MILAPLGLTAFHEPCCALKMALWYFSGNILPV